MSLELVGETFGRLTVLSRAENTRQGATTWLCSCECGTPTTVRGDNLKNGNTRSCGCYESEARVANAKALWPRATLAAKAALRGVPVKADDEITYSAAHKRVRSLKGRPSEHACIDCGGQAAHWSLRRDAAKVHLGTSRRSACKYSGNPEDYEPRCPTCHIAYDSQGVSA